MSTSAGTRLGPYEIVSKIASGGMGEVWKARDTRLSRFVAVKLSDEKFTTRFEREAQAVAALNHPHICQLYDIGPDYLVMELVDGAPLKGPLALDQALRLGIQLLSAIEAAHRKNITHGDLKPANILQTKSGIKVLDFGLAEIEREKAATIDEPASRTITQEGLITGTLGYMAPEQLRGEKADRRADLFAFGCVFYEMLTGQRAFDGSNAASVIGAILERDAPSLAALAPAEIDWVVKRCLAKDPNDRWQTARDLRAELERIAEQGWREFATGSKHSNPVRWALFAGLATLAVPGLAALAYVAFHERAVELTPVRFSIAGPDNGRFDFANRGVVNVAISPDGKRIAFSAAGADGRAQIWLRSLDSLTARPLAGTEDGAPGCWSPDSKSIGFFAAGKLKRIDVAAGAAAVALADAVDQRGCAWNQNGVILFAPNSRSPLYRVTASGGSAALATTLDAKAIDLSHRFPFFLPDGKHFLYASWKSAFHVTLRLASLDSREAGQSLQEADSSALYAQGYLLFLRGTTLMAQPFDAKRLSLSGDAVSVADEVQASWITAGLGAFSVSSNGTLVYEGGAAADLRLTWFDRSGKRLGVLGEPGNLGRMAFSPDRKKCSH
jgi:eukaryotic-like serine/threonine-protein kinase